MKLVGKIIALVLAGIVTVLAVQQVIRRMYHRFKGRYFELPTNDASDTTEE